MPIPMHPDPAKLAPVERAVFDFLAGCAATGRRAPKRGELDDRWPLGASIVGDLAKKGYLVVRVYARNWRDIEILVGEHAGKRTMPPPKPWRCYLTIGRETVRSDWRSRPETAA